MSLQRCVQIFCNRLLNYGCLVFECAELFANSLLQKFKPWVCAGSLLMRLVSVILPRSFASLRLMVYWLSVALRYGIFLNIFPKAVTFKYKDIEIDNWNVYLSNILNTPEKGQLCQDKECYFVSLIRKELSAGKNYIFCRYQYYHRNYDISYYHISS